jgi:hypothetical protein
VIESALERIDMKEPGRATFEDYNQAGENPGRAWDGLPVPTWANLSADVRAKWAAAEEGAGVCALDAFGKHRPEFASCLDVALHHFEHDCYAHNGPLSVRVFLEHLKRELAKLPP